MLFKANKYTRWYYNIVDRANTRADLGTYVESHHIVPRSLGGDNSKSNLVKLTAREHFICHWLLTKMTSGAAKYKMVYACKKMMHGISNKHDRYVPKSRIYENLKKELNQALKGQKHTEQALEKMRISQQKRAATESAEAKAIRRETMIKVNKARKGKKKDYMTGSNNYFYHNKFIGEANHFYGKHHSEETLNKLRVPKTKFVCEHCSTIVGGKSNYIRWHGDNCKIIKEKQNA